MRNASHSASSVLQVLDLRAAVEADHVEVDAVAALQVRGREQVAHQLLGVDAVGARHHHEAHRVARGRTRRAGPPAIGSFFARICAAICSITFDADTW